MTGGVVIAAPSSGSGKTVITLALLRALRAAGIEVGSLKIGPDYIDPGFHRVASGAECRNYDPWAMRLATLESQRDCVAGQVDLIVAEGVTGLFDGAADGTGSTADAANQLGWPILLVVDVKGQGASAAALVEGFAHHRKDTKIAGVIFNRVGSERHRAMLATAMASTGIPILAMVPRDAVFDLPDRHLGLVQAAELSGLDRQIDEAAALISAEIDLTALADLAGPVTASMLNHAAPPVPPPGQRVAVAADDAFSFAYPHILDGWRDAGTEISTFSPLADQAPDTRADAVYLPGGYPELHAGLLAGNRHFMDGIRGAPASWISQADARRGLLSRHARRGLSRSRISLFVANRGRAGFRPVYGGGCDGRRLAAGRVPAGQCDGCLHTSDRSRALTQHGFASDFTPDFNSGHSQAGQMPRRYRAGQSVARSDARQTVEPECRLVQAFDTAWRIRCARPARKDRSSR